MTLRASEQLDHALAQIRREEQTIHAWAFLAEQDVCRQAETLDELDEDARSRMPLFGLPIAIKDVIHVANMPTRAGSPVMNGFVAPEDAGCVRRLRSAGALFFGKTVTTEFAFFDPGPTTNPRNTGHTPGGSSSGSAAAVAAGFCPAALGTQTLGLVIRPAAYCGVFAIKPTYDAVSRDGVIPLTWSLDHVGVFSQSAALAASVAEAIFDDNTPGERPGGVARESAAARSERLRGFRVGLPDRYFTEGCDSTVRRGVEAGLEALRKAGAQVRNVRLPALLEASVAAAGILMRVEVATFHRKWFDEQSDRYSPKLRSVVESGRGISGVEYLKARQIRREAACQMRQLWEQVDFLFTPSTPTTAPEGLSWTGDPVFNTPFSVVGCPAINLPASYSGEGLPSGVQIAGPPWSEAQLLRLACCLEEQGFGQVLPHKEARN